MSCTVSTTPGTITFNPSPVTAMNYRAQVNQYFQKNFVNPRYDYIEDYSTGKPLFKCTIQYTLNGRTIRKDSGGFHLRKDDAREMASYNVLLSVEAKE